MALKTSKFDAADYLETTEDISHFLEDAFAEGDPAFIAHALGIVARSKGMSELADQVGVSRQSLYVALSESGNPSLSTFLGVLKALGLKLVPTPVPEAA